MVAYSFKQRFVGAIKDGTKRQTIRMPRKVRGHRPSNLAECRTPEEMAGFIRGHAPVGSALQLYTAMRTSHCRMIGTATCCSVEPVRLDFEAQQVQVGGAAPLDDLPALDAFAQADGLADYRGLCEFWRETHAKVQRWEGVLIRWTDFTLPVAA